MPAATRLSPEERHAFATGRRSFERGDLDSARHAFERILIARPGFADVHYMMGLLHEQAGELEEATSELEEALRINPAYAEARLALVSVYEQRGDYARAEQVAVPPESAAPERPGDPELDPVTRARLANLQAALGDAYREAEQLPEAIEAYRKALERAPRFHDVRHRLGVTLREAGLPHQAIREFQRILRVHPGYLDAAVQLGLTWYTLGRSDRAIAVWREVLRRDGAREDARMYLQLVRAGRAPEQDADAAAPTASDPDTGGSA